ncbi:MAG: Hsp20/alpha crystallin family protein [Acetobacteraceae bacterium]|nr:Hsp20/alpha crystallin family protein [Acetobacteraceae bacterium]
MDKTPSFPAAFGQALRGLTDPFTVMRREMERLFQEMGMGSPLPAGFVSPKVDVAETETGLEIHAELPGVKPEEISLDLDEGVLTLKAERSEEKKEEDKDKRWHIVERSSGTFIRRFALPFPAKEEEISASFENGVLKVTIPRAVPAPKPQRKIEIRTGG